MVFFRLFKQRSTKAASTGKDKSPAPEQPVVKKEQAKPKPAPAPKAQRKLPEMYQGRKWSMNDPIPYDSISAEDVSFQNVQHVMDSWQTVTMIENWQGIAGELLLRKMFELEPAFRVQFGYTEDADWNDPKVYQDTKFVNHGIALVVAVHKAIQFLGPDLEPLEQDLEQLGRRHIHMGAKPEYWPSVGEALFHTLEAALGDDFTPEVKKSWEIVYHFLAFYMIRGLLAQLSGN